MGSPRTRVSVFQFTLEVEWVGGNLFLVQKWRRGPCNYLDKCAECQCTDNVLNRLLSVNVSTLIMLESFLNYE